MKRLNSVHSSLLVFILATLLWGCTSKTVCPEDTKTARTEIVSVTAPESMHQGQQATLTIAVRNERSACVKDVNAYFTNIGLDSLLVTAELEYLNDPVPADCDCRRDTVLYTLLYFTPLHEGTYRIVTAIDSSVTNAHPGYAGDITTINVD